MHKYASILMTFAAGCSPDANHLGNPLLFPLNAIGTSIGNASYNATRGKVEVFVKTNHPALIADIQRGGGPIRTGVPLSASVAARAVPQDPTPITQGRFKGVTVDGTGPVGRG